MARVQKQIVGKSLTKKSMQRECDINHIMSRYQKTGTIEHANKVQGTYGFASSKDFRESLEIVKQAEGLFNNFPSSIRRRFDNDPSKFLDFVQDDGNKEEMYDLGLLERPETPFQGDPEPDPAPTPDPPPQPS